MGIFQQGSPWTTPGRTYSKRSKEKPTREVWDFPLCAMTLHQMLRQWYLCRSGHSVPVFGHDQLDDMREWAQQYAQGTWIELAGLIKDADFQEELLHRARAGSWEPSSTRVAITMDTLKVKAGKRMIGAAWGIELDPAEAYHSIDAEAELANMLSMEIQKEIDAEIFKGLNLTSPNGLAKRAINRHKPVWWFVFADPRDATLFKLTWGGE